MPTSSFVLSLILLILGIISKQQAFLVTGFEFDRDADTELCKKDTITDPDVCTSNSTMWFSCPISCAQAFQGGRGTMAEERNNPEKFYELHTKRATLGAGVNDINVSDMSLEENEGYITLLAVLPMLPGMTAYYYDAIEHIAQVYKYTLVAMILPYYDSIDEQNDSKSSSSSTTILQSMYESRREGKQERKTKSILLDGHDQQKSVNEVLEYLLSREVVAGTLGDPKNFDNHNIDDNMLLRSRPNIFLVSHTGMFIERVVSPTMEMIERRIKVHELAMEDNHEL